MAAAFLPQEFAQRRQAAGHALGERGFAALLAVRAETLHWLTGAEPMDETLPHAVLLEADGRTTLCAGLAAHSPGASVDAVAVDELRPWTAPSAVADLEALLAGRGLRGFPVAVDGHAGEIRGLDRLPENAAEWTHAGDVIERLRACKSPRELAYIRRAAGLADDAFDAAHARATPGAWEGEILAAMAGAVLQGGGELPARGVRIASGDRQLTDLDSAPRRHLSDHDRLSLAWTGVYRGYPAARTATRMIDGGAEDRLAAIAGEALAAARETCRPGAICAEVFQASACVVERAGLRMAGDCGHAASPRFEPLVRPEPVLMAGNTAALVRGMALLLRVDVYCDDTGRHATAGETVEVTEAAGVSLHRDDPSGVAV